MSHYSIINNIETAEGGPIQQGSEERHSANDDIDISLSEEIVDDEIDNDLSNSSNDSKSNVSEYLLSDDPSSYESFNDSSGDEE